MFKRILVVLLIGLVLLTLLPTAGMARERVRARSPWFYGLASFLIPGIGQYLNDEPGKALMHFGVAVLIPTVFAIAAGFILPPPFGPIVTGFLSLGWHTYSAIDAYTTAERFNILHRFVVNSPRWEWAAVGIEQNPHSILAPVINATFALNSSRWEGTSIGGLNEHNHNFGLCWVGNSP